MSAPTTKRKLVGYGDCRCVLTQYCDGKCRPIFADVPIPDAPSRKGADTDRHGSNQTESGTLLSSCAVSSDETAAPTPKTVGVSHE